MNFNSLQFLVFLPVVVLLYYLLPHKSRWVLLLAASYIFYMSWNLWLIFLILVTTVTAYVAGIIIDRTESKKAKKACLIVTLVICLGILVFFKYINFLLESAVGIIRLFDADRDGIVLNVILPVGISFYTFQTLSYVIDVYRGDFEAEKHFGYFALYVSFFPQLVAGPIERPQTLLPQLRTEQRLQKENVIAGLKLLLAGFFRKCVVADFCGMFADKVYGDLANANALAVFAASALFFIQIYNDFAGYSEIALGSARLMGVKLSRNFDKPLTSASYTEFFKRWHITLNQWFTQYVYIPLGGNRKGKARKILNTLIVFALCGLWHGANWTFVLWGLVAGVMISLETLLKKPFEKLCEKLKFDPENATFTLVRRVFVFLLFTCSCVLFRAQSIAEVGIAFDKLFTAWGAGEAYFSAAMDSLGMDAAGFFRLAIFLAGMALIYRLPQEEDKTEAVPSGVMEKRIAGTELATYVFTGFSVAFCWLALLSVSDASGFAYFQF